MESDQHSNPQLLLALEAFKTASKSIQHNPTITNSPSMNALLELQTNSVSLFSGDPRLSTLSHLLSRLKTIASAAIQTNTKETILCSFLRRLSCRKKLSIIAKLITSEIQSWIDRETAHRLVTVLTSSDSSDEDKKTVLIAMEDRLRESGFDRNLQDVLLVSQVFAVVESVLADTTTSNQVRDCCAAVVLAMVQFNKAVFVGQVLMGPTIKLLIAAGSPAALRALTGIIAAIRSPIIDEVHVNNDIPKIIGMLKSDDYEVRVMALEMVLEISYHCRKEIIGVMFKEGLVKRLLELQRSELKAFASCVARFAIQVEVGEGLVRREKRETKMELLRRVKEAATDEAEEATVLAEVLWGSTRW